MDSRWGSGVALAFLVLDAGAALLDALLGGGDGEADLPSSRFRFSSGFRAGAVLAAAAAVVLAAAGLVAVVLEVVAPAAGVGVAALDRVVRAG